MSISIEKNLIEAEGETLNRWVQVRAGGGVEGYRVRHIASAGRSVGNANV